MESPKRVEHQMTDKGYVPVYTTSVVDQPWDTYTDTDHSVWAQ
ncbi:MAG: phenylalanine 4-monooxygenase, partial [Lysobacter spongiicola]|nr:phenylalanine 4-monooxygenase [Lysobacter spongiicola]